MNYASMEAMSVSCAFIDKENRLPEDNWANPSGHN